MRVHATIIGVVALVLATALPADAQTYEVRLVQSVTNGNDTVVVEIRRTDVSTFVMGTSTFVFNYNTAALFAPVKVASYDGPWDNSDGDYLNIALVRDSLIGFAGLIVEFQGGDDDNGVVVPATFTRVGGLRFSVKNASLTPTLAWRNVGANTQVQKLTSPGVFEGGQTDITGTGNFLTPSDPPLPIQLSSFAATVVGGSQVRLDWATVSETNNYGFEVQKSQGNQNNYQAIPNSFVPGHGTTNEPHSYSFVDNTASSGMWFYRLKQIDLDGSVHFTEGVQVDMLAGVSEKPLPKEFALDQNYPNPFNPSTKIEYAVPKESRVRLEVYNLLGQRIATLVDEVKSAGYYTASFDAVGLSSGLYFYRMNAGEVSFLKKMMLVK